MVSKVRKRLSFANVVSLMALFVALGGTSYAAISLSKNSVRSKHIKNGQVKRADIRGSAVDSTKVRDASLLARDFQAGQIPAGPQGLRGPEGPPGAPGSALAFARVAATGNVDENFSKNITDANVTREATSAYCFRNLPFTFKSAVATVEYDGDPVPIEGIQLAIAPNGFTTDCAGGAQVEVATLSGTDYGPEAFYIVFN